MSKILKTVFGVMAALIITLGITTFAAQTDANRFKKNYYAMRDSIEQIELKNGELISEKQALILEKDEFEDYMAELGITDRKDLENKLNSKVKYITNVETQLLIDTIETVHDSIVYVDNYPTYKFCYDEKYLHLNGETAMRDSIPQTTLYDIEVPVGLTVGLTDQRNIFVKSDNPYMEIREIRGAELDKSTFKKFTSKFGFGVQAGIGGQYGLINKEFDVGPYVGLGISYKLF